MPTDLEERHPKAGHSVQPNPNGQAILWLKVWLGMIAAIQGSAILAVVMPDTWMDYCAKLMGVEPLPHTPLAGYLARLSSIMYVVHAATLAIVAAHLPQSLFMVRPLAVVTFGLGGVMLGIDLSEGMPAPWTIVELVALTFSGSFTWWLATVAAQSS